MLWVGIIRKWLLVVKVLLDMPSEKLFIFGVGIVVMLKVVGVGGNSVLLDILCIMYLAVLVNCIL